MTLAAELKNVSASDARYKVEDIPLDALWSDPEFNCRGRIAPVDIIDLAKDIEARGLDQPIVVRPWNEPSKPEVRFKTVAGHRREMAFRYNKATTIPGYVRADLDELQARMLNLRENLHRKQLNVKQEAHALKFFLSYKRAGSHLSVFTEQELAEIFGQSRGWVQNRKHLLSLPEDIQNEAAAGMLTSDQIRRIASLKSRTDQYELVKKIKTAKLKGEKIKLTPTITRSGDVLKARERDIGEVREMNGMLYDLIGPGLLTRYGAWVAGDISTTAFFETVKSHCADEGIKFMMPKFITDAIQGIVNKQAGVFNVTTG